MSLGYREEYLGNSKYNLIKDDEAVGVVGRDTIIKLIDNGELIEDLLLEDKVSNGIEDIAIIKVDKCKVYENINNIDRLYIIGDSRETVDIKECNVREIIILGEIGVKLGKFDKNSTDIDDININGKIKIEIIKW